MYSPLNYTNTRIIIILLSELTGFSGYGLKYIVFEMTIIPTTVFIELGIYLIKYIKENKK